MAAGDEHGGAGRQLASQPANDFSLMLLNTIEAVKNDPAQFRNLIYEMARVSLQKEAWHRNPPMNILELRRMMLALEIAIERVETTAAQRDAVPTLAPADVSDIGAEGFGPTHDAIVLIDHAPINAPAATTPAAFAHGRPKLRVPAPLKAILRLGALAVLAAGIVLVLDRELHLLNPAPPAAVEHAAAPVKAPPSVHTAAAAPAQQVAAPAPSPSGPLPDVYGVYAVSGGKLYELEPLVGRAPDQRVFMSAVLKTPSHTVLPDGQVSFIVYRRDIASNAPDRVTVRVVAKITRAMTFTKTGQAVTAKVDDEWAIRNVAFDYRVAPSTDSPEMILIKPESEATALAAGRYALIIKGQAYDFTVDGPVTQTAQCLERTEAVNGTFYTECRAL